MSLANQTEQYDLISLGSGEAGKYLTWTFGKQGKRCAIVERRWLGGSCPNVACLPSKNVIHSAKIYQLASHGERFGVSCECGKSDAKADMNQVKQRKQEMIDGLTVTHKTNFENSKNEVVWGDGKFVSPKTIEVTNPEGQKRLITADTIIVCTGSRALIGNIPGLKESEPLTHVEMLDISQLPRHLIILGGGYVGLEFAQAIRRFGTEVTVLEHSARILKREDEDIASLLQEILEKDGVRFITSTSPTEVIGKSGEEVTIKANQNGKEIEIKGSHILCATGRVPNTEGINAEVAGIKLTEHGHIAVDESNRTSAEGIYAVGDCANSPHFTHIAFDDFRIVRDHLFGKKVVENRRSGRQVPFTLFTDPEFAHIGLREHEAKAKGMKYRLAKVPMMAFLRTRTLGETTGFAKALIGDDDTILGFTAVGAGVGELLPVVQLAMRKGLPFSDVGELVITHPTLSEGLVALFSAVPERK